MAAGRGAALLPAGILAILFAFALMPRCSHMSPFAMLCLSPWLPVMVTLIVLGGGAIAFGAHSLLKAYGVV